MLWHYYAQRPGWDAGGFVFGILGFVFWLAVIWLVISMIVRHSHHSHGWWHQETKETPLEIAQTRYAKGEITKDEFTQIKKDLA